MLSINGSWLQTSRQVKCFAAYIRLERLGERGLTEKAVWHVVREYAAKAGIDKLAPHDLLSYAACLTMPDFAVGTAPAKLGPGKCSA